MENAIRDCLRLRLDEIKRDPDKEIMIYMADDISISIKYDNPNFSVFSTQTGMLYVSSQELFDFIDNNDLNILIIAVFVDGSELESFSEQGGWIDPDPEEPESESESEPEIEEIREMQVLNARGEPETRLVRVPRARQINIETHDFNRGQPNPHPPKMVPFNFKRKWNWNGDCIICMDSTPQSWCRVNCPSGHVFHCACIKEFTNTLKNTDVVGYSYREGNFNDQCPLCGLKFTQLSELPDPQGLINRFGKKRSRLHSDLKYLQRLKCKN